MVQPNLHWPYQKPGLHLLSHRCEPRSHRPGDNTHLQDHSFFCCQTNAVYLLLLRCSRPAPRPLLHPRLRQRL